MGHSQDSHSASLAPNTLTLYVMPGFDLGKGKETSLASTVTVSFYFFTFSFKVVLVGSEGRTTKGKASASCLLSI